MKKFFSVILSFACAMPVESQSVFNIQGGTRVVCHSNPYLVLQDISQFNNNESFVSASGTVIIQSGLTSCTLTPVGAATFDFNNITIDNTNGVQLGGPISINDNLSLVGGNLILNNYSISLGASGIINGESETARLMDMPSNAGPVSISQILSASPNLNPGNIGIEIDATNSALGNTTITRYCGAVIFHGNSIGLIQRYYDIHPANNSGLNATAKFYYLDAELNGVDPSTAVLWKSKDNGNTWSLITPDARDGSSKFLLKNNIDDFSLWTIGSSNSALPVIYSAFNAGCTENGAVLSWSTQTEENSDYFILQKSSDGSTWNNIDTIDAKGAASTYSFTDAFGGLAWYRLEQVDKDGKAGYSAVIQSNCSISEISILVYPNPASSYTNLVFQSPYETNLSIQVMDAAGGTVRSIPLHVIKGRNEIRVNLVGLNGGTYILVVRDQSINIAKEILVY